MLKISKRVTIYLEPELHRLLKFRSIETSRSVSDLVNDAVRHELAEDQKDFKVFWSRAKESTIAYKQLLKELKAAGKF